MIKKIPHRIWASFEVGEKTGIIYRLHQQGNYRANSACSSLTTTKKYIKVRFEGKDYLAHRVAWFLYYWEQPPDVIDHLDGNGLNNSKENLRAATNSTNQMNIKVTTKSKSGVKGVFPVRGGKLWRAEVCIDGKRHQKHSVRREVVESWVISKREELHGDFACN